MNRSGQGRFALSREQRRLWLVEQLSDAAAYVLIRAHRLRGPVNQAALARAVTDVGTRHDALRVGVVETSEGPMIQPDASSGPVLEVLPTDGCRPEACLAAAVERATRPFALDEGDVMRVVLAPSSPDDAVLVHATHHLLTDGVSRTVVERDLGRAYAHAVGCGDRAGGVRDQAASFLDHLRTVANEEPDDLGYWCSELADLAELRLEADPPGRNAGSTAGAEIRCQLDPASTTRLRELAAEEKTSLFTVVLAAYQYVLGTSAGADRFAVGTAVAGRLELEHEETVGYFTKVVPVVCEGLSGHSLRSLVRRRRDRMWDLLDHQDVPYEQVATRLAYSRRGVTNPFFQHWFSLTEGPVDGDLRLSGVQVELLHVENTRARFDTELEWTVSDTGCLDGTMTYAVDRIREITARRLTRRVCDLLGRVAEAPDQPLETLGVLDADERSRLLLYGDGGSSTRPPQHLTDRIARVVRSDPTRAAVIEGEHECGYAELWDRARKLAAALADEGVRRGAVVGVQLPRGIDLVAAMLGAGLVGAAYLPMDPDLPTARTRVQLREAGAEVVIAGEDIEGFRRVDPRPARYTDAAGQHEDSIEPGADDLMYLVYTSGSTGKPKGVAVSQRQFGFLVDWHLARYGLGPGDVVAFTASPSFDALGWEVWPALVAGATLRPCPAELVRDPAGLVGWLAEVGATVAFLPTPLAQQVIRYPLGRRTALRVLLTGGDVFRPGAEDDPGVPVVDHYGPTENAVVATATEELAAPWTDRSIGRPISGVRAYVLDEHGYLSPEGAVGELYLGGGAVADGYWRRAGLTAERFVPDPYAPTPGARMYRTGDFVAWQQDGTLRYVGRRDQQLEINGHRIEPAEAERALSAHPKVTEAVVVAMPTPAGSVLAAAVVLDTDGDAPNPDQLRETAGEVLPGYMVPQLVRAVPGLPRTPSGKVDRRWVAAELAEAVVAVPPETPTERAMARLWQEVLGASEISVTDDFFALGGNSMIATRLLARINEAFGTRLPLRAVFDLRSLRAISERVRELVLADVAAMTEEDVRTWLARGTNAPS